MEVNQKELAACLGITARSIRNLKSDGLFQSPPGSRKYRLEDCVREYIEFKINAETGRRASVSKERIQAEHEEVKKQISLLKLRKLRRELHEAADVEYFLTDMLTRFKNRLLALPSKLALIVTGETDVNKVIEIIQKELFNALEELSEYNPDEIDHQEAAEDFDSEEDDQDGTEDED